MSDRTFTSSSLPSNSPVDLLGIAGMLVWCCWEFADERRLLVDTVPAVEPCRGCGQRAESKGRATVEVRDLPIAGKATRLVWVKRVWRCRDCGTSWREGHPEISPRAVLTSVAEPRRDGLRHAFDAERFDDVRIQCGTDVKLSSSTALLPGSDIEPAGDAVTRPRQVRGVDERRCLARGS